MPKIHNQNIFNERKSELRKNSTQAEQDLWFYLRNKKLGFKFKRQHDIGGYITDFYCAEKKLIIELDGEVHETKEAKEYDKVRDVYFEELGYKVLRFKNREVEGGVKTVLNKIKNFL